MRALLLVALALASACGAPPGSGLECGVPPLVFDAYRGDLQAELDGDCARVERTPTPLEPGWICKACPYDVHRVVVVRAGERFDVRDADRLEYTPTHHNWADVITAVLDDGRRAELVFRYLGGALGRADGWALELSLLDEDGALTDGPVALALLGASP